MPRRPTARRLFSTEQPVPPEVVADFLTAMEEQVRARLPACPVAVTVGCPPGAVAARMAGWMDGSLAGCCDSGHATSTAGPLRWSLMQLMAPTHPAPAPPSPAPFPPCSLQVQDRFSERWGFDVVQDQPVAHPRYEWHPASRR